MAYATGTTSGAEDLLNKLEAFASANGWTVDDSAGSSSGKLALHKGDCYVSFRYDPAVTSGAQIVSVHQATGHTPSAAPGDHPEDSGSGYNATTSVDNNLLDNERFVNLGLSEDEIDNAYWFFEQDSGPAYIHIVVGLSNNVYRHFGFGNIEKFGTWTGGEYAYGHFTRPLGSSAGSLPTPFTGSTHCVLLDGRTQHVSSSGSAATISHAATLHIEGFPDEDPSSVWGEIKPAKRIVTKTDSAGNPRFAIQGGYRGGPLTRCFGNISTGRRNAFVNMIPIDLWAYAPQADPAADRVYYLGSMPDVRGIVLDGIAPAEEIVVGSETWVCFPSYSKSESAYTLFQGVAYRKETA